MTVVTLAMSDDGLILGYRSATIDPGCILLINAKFAHGAHSIPHDPVDVSLVPLPLPLLGDSRTTSYSRSSLMNVRCIGSVMIMLCSVSAAAAEADLAASGMVEESSFDLLPAITFDEEIVVVR
jgi:hypothetical protein